MGWVKDNFFGGAAKDAAKQQTKAIEEASNITQEATEQARGDIMSMFPMAQQNLLAGNTGALDLFSQAMPQQMQATQQGNLNAQQMLLAGLPQMQNALLGNQIDYSGLQAQQQALPSMAFSMPQYQTQPTGQLPTQQESTQPDIGTLVQQLRANGGVQSLLGGITGYRSGSKF